MLCISVNFLCWKRVLDGIFPPIKTTNFQKNFHLLSFHSKLLEIHYQKSLCYFYHNFSKSLLISSVYTYLLICITGSRSISANKLQIGMATLKYACVRTRVPHSFQSPSDTRPFLSIYWSSNLLHTYNKSVTLSVNKLIVHSHHFSFSSWRLKYCRFVC